MRKKLFYVHLASKGNNIKENFPKTMVWKTTKCVMPKKFGCKNTFFAHKRKNKVEFTFS
jgi:hypothetical protein